MPEKLGYENGLVTGFEPKFRSLDDDQERYLFAIVELADAGVIESEPGKPLYPFAEKGYDWLTKRYFEKGKLDEIERHFTADDFSAFAMPHEATQAIIDRFAAMGQIERARRLWRAHVGQLRARYWQEVSLSKTAGPVPMLGESEAERAQRHADWLARIAENRRTLMTVMDACRGWLAALPGRPAGVAREIDRLDVARTEVDSGVRRKPGGKPDPRAMDEALFWEIIEAGLDGESEAERVDLLPERLARFKPAAIRKFAEILRDKDDAAYRSDVWALAYVLRGGCSDDAFDGFRGWLILHGRRVYEAVLADPDGFDVARYDDREVMGLRGAAEIAFEMRAGKPMKALKARARKLGGPVLEEADFEAFLPKVAARKEAR